MAMKAYILGTKAVIKQSGGKWFLSKAVSWTGKKSLRPEAVKERNEDFSTAVAGCKRESKSKGGTVWGVSEFNKCIGEKLEKTKAKAKAKKTKAK